MRLLQRWPTAESLGSASRAYLVRAKEGTIGLLATQLLSLGAQRRAWERRMGELLLGAARAGRSR